MRLYLRKQSPFAILFSRPEVRITFLFALGVLGFGAGCSTFKYTPGYDHVYAPIVNRRGLAIAPGEDSRLEAEKRPSWAKNAATIAARALTDEVKHARLFDRVKTRPGSLNSRKFSEVVQLRVIKFECYNQTAFLETTGRKILDFQGIQGALISKSIPSKYVSEVEIEFTVLDASTQEKVLARTYVSERHFLVNGYQGNSRKIRMTSEALESVITQFVADLAKLPISQQRP